MSKTAEKFKENTAKLKENTNKIKEQVKDTCKRNNVFDKDVRTRMKEDGSYKLACTKLTNAYKMNNEKYIDKFFENTDAADTEKIWRDAVYNEGGHFGAQLLSNEFVLGASYIHDPVKYQGIISKYDHYNLALLAQDKEVELDPDYITDALADNINAASTRFGFKEVFNFEKKDENGATVVEFDPVTNMPLPTIERNPEKVILNPKKLPENEPVDKVIDAMEITDDQKAKLKKVEAKRQIQINKYNDEHRAPEIKVMTNEEIDAARDAWLEEQYKLYDFHPATKPEKKNIFDKFKKNKNKEEKAEDQNQEEKKPEKSSEEKHNDMYESIQKDQPPVSPKVPEIIPNAVVKEENEKAKAAEAEASKPINLKEMVNPFENLYEQESPTADSGRESASSTES